MNRVGPAIAYAPVRSGVVEVDPRETVTRQWTGKSPKPDRDVRYHLDPVGGERQTRVLELEG